MYVAFVHRFLLLTTTASDTDPVLAETTVELPRVGTAVNVSIDVFTDASGFFRSVAKVNHDCYAWLVGADQDSMIKALISSAHTMKGKIVWTKTYVGEGDTRYWEGSISWYCTRCPRFTFSA